MRVSYKRRESVWERKESRHSISRLTTDMWVHVRARLLLGKGFVCKMKGREIRECVGCGWEERKRRKKRRLVKRETVTYYNIQREGERERERHGWLRGETMGEDEEMNSGTFMLMLRKYKGGWETRFSVVCARVWISECISPLPTIASLFIQYGGKKVFL